MLQPIHADVRARGVLAAALEAGRAPGGDVTDVGVAIELYNGAAPAEPELHETLERLAALGLLEGPDLEERYRVPFSGVGTILLEAFDDVEAEIAALR